MANPRLPLDDLFFENVERWLVEEQTEHLQTMQNLEFDIHQPIAKVLYNDQLEIVHMEIHGSKNERGLIKKMHMRGIVPVDMGLLGAYLHLKEKSKKPISKSFLQFLLNSGEDWIEGQPFNCLNQLFSRPQMTSWFEEFLQEFELNKKALLSLKFAMESKENIAISLVMAVPNLDDYFVQIQRYQTLVDNQLMKIHLHETLPHVEHEQISRQRL